MATDFLARLPLPQVAAFYARLADSVDARKGALSESLAAKLMRLWLTNRDPKANLEIEAPLHLRNHPLTVEAIRYHRQVFLTQQKARRGGAEVWGGIVPRLKGKPPYDKWDLRSLMSMEYESLVEIPLRYQLTGTDADRDLLYSLHGFQLHSNVTVAGEQSAGGTRVRIKFISFDSYAWDTYDWDYSEHLTVPNPDFGSRLPNAVAPEEKTIVVFHSNAKRLEDALMAAPYRFHTKSWQILDSSMVATAEVDPDRSF